MYLSLSLYSFYIAIYDSQYIERAGFELAFEWLYARDNR